MNQPAKINEARFESMNPFRVIATCNYLKFKWSDDLTHRIKQRNLDNLAKSINTLEGGKQSDETLIRPVMDPQLDPRWRTRLTARHELQPARVHTRYGILTGFRLEITFKCVHLKLAKSPFSRH